MGKLFVISGASGVGKGSLLKGVMARRPDLSFSVSATTRAPRPGEVDGVHYYFISKECFEEMIKKDEFLEYDAHAANYYGTPEGQLNDKLTRGSVLLDIEPKGAQIVRKKRPDAVLIFVMPPSEAELERRLRSRGDTPEDQIAMRMERAKWEMEQRNWYDHVVINDDLESCIEQMLKIIALETANN